MGKKNKVEVNEDFFTQLENELKNFRSDIGNYVAKEASQRLSKVAKASIKHFYDDYHPKAYSRHYQFETKAYRHYRNSNTAEGIYYGGIRLTPELFNDVYAIDKYKVYGMVMGCEIDNTVNDLELDYESIGALGGYHGPLSIFNDDPPATRPDTITQIFDELDNIYLESDKILDDAIASSKTKRNYKILKF